ncbi:MAG: hypothetical protein ACREFZ_05765 [Acetobacteraceae bacterium]
MHSDARLRREGAVIGKALATTPSLDQLALRKAQTAAQIGETMGTTLQVR